MPVALSQFCSNKPWLCIRRLKLLSRNVDWTESHIPLGNGHNWHSTVLVQCYKQAMMVSGQAWKSSGFIGGPMDRQDSCGDLQNHCPLWLFWRTAAPQLLANDTCAGFVFLFFAFFLNLARLHIFSSSVLPAATLLAKLAKAKDSGVFSSQPHPFVTRIRTISAEKIGLDSYNIVVSSCLQFIDIYIRRMQGSSWSGNIWCMVSSRKYAKRTRNPYYADLRIPFHPQKASLSATI